MTENEIKKQIIKYLKKKKPIKSIYKKNIDNFNFLGSGHIDSLELIKFNFFLEIKFKIKFNHKDLANEKFRFVSGLASIIKKKLSDKQK